MPYKCINALYVTYVTYDSLGALRRCSRALSRCWRLESCDALEAAEVMACARGVSVGVAVGVTTTAGASEGE